MWMFIPETELCFEALDFMHGFVNSYYLWLFLYQISNEY